MDEAFTARTECRELVLDLRQGRGQRAAQGSVEGVGNALDPALEEMCQRRCEGSAGVEGWLAGKDRQAEEGRVWLNLCEGVEGIAEPLERGAGHRAQTPAGLLTQVTSSDESLNGHRVAGHRPDLLDLGNPESAAPGDRVVEGLEPRHLVLGPLEPDLGDTARVEGDDHALHAGAEDNPHIKPGSAKQIAGVVATDACHKSGP